MPRLLPRLVFWAIHLWILGYIVVLALALVLQFAANELPCPLCMLQRYGMILSTLGALLILSDARNRSLTPLRYLQGLGLGALGAVAGAGFAVRQVLLHILPGDVGYGGPVMGFHLYTWSLVTFCVVVVFTAILAILAPVAMPEAPPEKGLSASISSAATIAFIAIVAINAVMIVFLEGFAWVLPDNPTSYGLLG